jgi:hypothetical protein
VPPSASSKLIDDDEIAGLNPFDGTEVGVIWLSFLLWFAGLSNAPMLPSFLEDTRLIIGMGEKLLDEAWLLVSPFLPKTPPNDQL